MTEDRRPYHRDCPYPSAAGMEEAVDDLLEALNARCGTCSGVLEVAWCAAWEAWLCMPCRSVRNDAELRTTLAAKAAMWTAQEVTAYARLLASEPETGPS